MTGTLILALGFVSAGINGAGIIAFRRGRLLEGWRLMFSGDVLALICTVWWRFWPLAALNAACALLAAWFWWRLRKGKGRLRAALSGKYRHVRDAMVRTLRDRRVPRRVLAPGAAS